jgi:hypothetical protein
MHRHYGHFAIISLMIAVGCGESTDFNAEYKLDETQANRGPAKTVARLLSDLDQQMRNREVDPKLAVQETVENFEGFTADSFGDKAGEFEKIKAALAEIQKQAEANASRAQLQELSSNLKELGDQLAADAVPSA